MKRLFPIILLSILCSCSFNQTELYGIGKTTSINVAGDGSTGNTILGNTYVAKNSTATKTIVNGAVTYGAAVELGKSHASDNALEGTKSGNSLKLEQSKLKAASFDKTTGAKQAVTEKAIEKAPEQIGPININAP